MTDEDDKGISKLSDDYLCDLLSERAQLVKNDPFLHQLTEEGIARFMLLLEKTEELTLENLDLKINLKNERNTKVVAHGVSKEQITETHVMLSTLMQRTLEIHDQVIAARVEIDKIMPVIMEIVRRRVMEE